MEKKQRNEFSYGILIGAMLGSLLANIILPPHENRKYFENKKYTDSIYNTKQDSLKDGWKAIEKAGCIQRDSLEKITEKEFKK